MKKFCFLFILLFIASAMNVQAQSPSLEIVGYEYHHAIVSASTNNASSMNLLIAITDVPKRNAQNQILPGGTFGTPQETYQVGDEIDGGGTVVYIGSASDNIEISGLTDNVTYHLQVWNIVGSNYSSEYAEASLLTWGKVPFTSKFALCQLAEIPLSWTLEEGDIFMQNTGWGTSWLQTSPLGVPGALSLTTQWILLAPGRNQLSFNYYMSVPTFGPFYVAITSDDWEPGSSLQIQLSNNDVDYVTVYTITKDNAHDFVHPRSQENLATLMTPEFNNFNGERVRVRIKLNMLMNLQLFMEDIHIAQTEIPDCDGVFNIEANPMVGGIAEISWSSYDEEADLWEVRYRVVGTENWTAPVEATTEAYTLTGLPFETRIEVQIRVVCSSVLSSDWASLIFTSGAEFLPCEYPVNLVVYETTHNSAILYWHEGNAENLSWDIRYREATVTEWTNVEGLVEKTYTLEELTPGTVYLWTVRAHCIGDRTSLWATQSQFITGLGINNSKNELMTVYATGKMISITNPLNRYIERVQVFGITGSLLGDYVVNSTDNVLITNDLSAMIAIVKIVGQNDVETHKILIKY